MDPLQLINELRGMLLRRGLVLGLVASLGVLVAFCYAVVQPSTYQASATILVESPQIADDLARSTISSSAAERLQLIQQRLMARNNLLAVIEKLGLFLDHPELTLTEQIDLTRKATTIESISVSGQGRGNEVEIFAFTITVRLDDGEQAAAMVNEFVESALEQNVRVRAERAQDTLEFFDNEEGRVGEAITALEAEISAFKSENEEALPESLEFRRDELARLQENDLEIDRRILELEEERGALETALDGGPLRADEPIPQSPEEAELRRLALDLAQRRRVLAPTHPDILRLQNQIAAVGELVSTFAADGAPIAAFADASEAQIAATRRQIALLTRQIASLQAQTEVLAARRAALVLSIRGTPEVEVALNAFNRRLLEMQDQYSVITRRRAEARTGAQLEINQQSERFSVVENALVPDKPVESSRRKIAVLGSGASIALAVGLVMLLEMLNPVIRTSAQMERQLSLRPVVSIPYVSTPGQRRRRRLAWLASLALLLIGLWFGSQLVDEHVMPLETIGANIGDWFERLLDAVRTRFETAD